MLVTTLFRITGRNERAPTHAPAPPSHPSRARRLRGADRGADGGHVARLALERVARELPEQRGLGRERGEALAQGHGHARRADGPRGPARGRALRRREAQQVVAREGVQRRVLREGGGSAAATTEALPPAAAGLLLSCSVRVQFSTQQIRASILSPMAKRTRPSPSHLRMTQRCLRLCSRRLSPRELSRRLG